MCGIAAFLGTGTWNIASNTDWLDSVLIALSTADAAENPMAAAEPLMRLAGRFDDLMSFGLFAEMASSHETYAKVEAVRNNLAKLRDAVGKRLLNDARNDDFESLHEGLNDYLWQVEREVLEGMGTTLELMPDTVIEDADMRSRQYLAWSTEVVLASIDRLEVRGRDSAGISIVLLLPEGVRPIDRLTKGQRQELERRMAIRHGAGGVVTIHELDDGRTVCRFIYKVAQLVGRLGDNCAQLRRAIHDDGLLWSMSDGMQDVSILAHTRWASNGIISITNCHPVDGVLEDCPCEGFENTVFVLNGDVDNYQTLVRDRVLAGGGRIPQTITTDAKILPALFCLAEDRQLDTEERFRSVLNDCEGSLAVIMQTLGEPETMHLAQKGSGQSFYIGRCRDGWQVASEAYGLASRCRISYPLAERKGSGVSLMLRSDAAAGSMPQMRPLDGGAPLPLEEEPIEIFSRDIYRGDYEHYIEKEIHEAASSVEKTLYGKYRRSPGRVEFLAEGFGNGPALVHRLTNGGQRINRIICIGQGTAAVAAMSVADSLRRSLDGSGITVSNCTGAELIGFVGREPMDDVLLVPVSQSGTTTDTNRVVDICKELGAWVNCIVNRRNSPLVRKSDSYIYTSNGRDVEMAVASTKAFYSQVAAGKLLALWLGDLYGTMAPEAVQAEVDALESLPGHIETVLSAKDYIAEVASQYASRHAHWALVGNGANSVAAREVRIKLSELCYKSIPCDVTEDKKHIDLSTEPLTLVMASDLPEDVVSDTVKEVTIFKAHNGRPIVFCREDEDRFDGVAEAVIKLPKVGSGLDFVMATVAGHWWGVAAAKAI
ncbi:SIS domain-containing protein, partial [Salidesulfovibrio brasiliensis]|uniref:SIS domain-containing protein n=1 Tax=Salidesulfovibrio brasiliensis TaxID=221711 RepID=UPI0006D019A7